MKPYVANPLTPVIHGERWEEETVVCDGHPLTFGPNELVNIGTLIVRNCPQPVNFYPGTSGKPSAVNALCHYEDWAKANGTFWKTPPKRYVRDLGSTISVIELEEGRMARKEEDYRLNRWLVQDKNGKVVPAECQEIAIMGGMVYVTLSHEPIIPGEGRFWTDRRENYVRNIRIGRISAYDNAIAGACFYGTDGLWIDEIQGSNRGKDAAVTIERSIAPYVGACVGSGNHNGYGGVGDVVFLYNTEGAYVGNGSANVMVQPCGCPWSGDFGNRMVMNGVGMAL